LPIEIDKSKKGENSSVNPRQYEFSGVTVSGKTRLAAFLRAIWLGVVCFRMNISAMINGHSPRAAATAAVAEISTEQGPVLVKQEEHESRKRTRDGAAESVQDAVSWPVKGEAVNPVEEAAKHVHPMPPGTTHTLCVGASRHTA